MAYVKIPNSLQDTASQSFITTAVTAGGTIVPVRNINSFTANYAIQIGNIGEERSEIKLISSISGLSLNTTGTTTFDHPTDTPVYNIKYDKVIFKRSTVGTAGTAVALTNGTITIQPDQTYTQFDDTTAQTTYAYKASFYNSLTAEESADSDWQTPSGYTFYSRARIRNRIREKLFSSDFIQSDDTINDWINEWLENMNNAAVHVNKDYSLGTADISFGTAGYGTITATDYKDIRRLWVATSGNSFYSAQRISQTDFQPEEVFPSSQPAYYPFGDNVFGVKPDGVMGTARISYYKLSTVLVNDADELPVSMRGYSKSFVDYGLSQALQVDGKPSEAQAKLAVAQQALSLFVSDITPRSNSGPRFIKILDEVSGDDY